MTGDVTIHGDGVAACACAQLLHRQGARISWHPSERATQPAIMLGLPTLRMLADIFAAPDFAQNFQPVRKRVVLWGASEPVEIPHAAVVVSEAALLTRIRTSFSPSSPHKPSSSSWTIRASRDTSISVAEHAFGSRKATAYAANLRPRATEESCWIESLDDGWLFLLPEGGGKARLLSVGNIDGDGLSKSRLISAQIETIEGPGTAFPSHPRISDPLCGPEWLACGTAALSFDPLCGEGAGHALREAILANAVIQAAMAGAEETDLLQHYNTRLIAGFARHLQTCVEFYSSGGRGPWWDEQVKSLRDGLEWCREQIEHQPRPKFRLENFALEAL